MAVLDTSWYVAVIAFAGQTPWLHTAALLYTNVGLVLFGVLLVLAWWRVRHAESVVMARALCAPVWVLLAWLISNLAKVVFREPRPCRVLHLVTVGPCEFATDYSFPSNHAVLAASAAVAVLLVHRRLGLLAVVLAVLMGFSRVYVGAHYPHDVLAGLLLGALVACGGLVAGPLLADRVRSARTGRWSPLLGTSGRSGDAEFQSIQGDRSRSRP